MHRGRLKIFLSRFGRESAKFSMQFCVSKASVVHRSGVGRVRNRCIEIFPAGRYRRKYFKRRIHSSFPPPMRARARASARKWAASGGAYSPAVTRVGHAVRCAACKKDRARARPGRAAPLQLYGQGHGFQHYSEGVAAGQVSSGSRRGGEGGDRLLRHTAISTPCWAVVWLQQK